MRQAAELVGDRLADVGDGARADGDDRAGALGGGAGRLDGALVGVDVAVGGADLNRAHLALSGQHLPHLLLQVLLPTPHRRRVGQQRDRSGVGQGGDEGRQLGQRVGAGDDASQPQRLQALGVRRLRQALAQGLQIDSSLSHAFS